MFRSAKYIENRPGLEDQSIEKVVKDLARVGAPNIFPGAEHSPQHAELANLLSDWHLVAFLGTTQLVSPVSCPLYISQSEN